MNSSKSKTYNAGNLILVADENQHDSRVICGFLEKQGYGTVPVFDFDALRHLLGNFTPDMIILDAMFDRSQEILEMTRSEDDSPRIPIIMIRNKHRYKVEKASLAN